MCWHYNKQPCHQFLIFKSSSSVLNPDQVSDVIRLEEHKHRATQRQFRLTIQASFHFFPIETLVTTLYLNDKEVTATFLSCASSLELTQIIIHASTSNSGSKRDYLLSSLPCPLEKIMYFQFLLWRDSILISSNPMRVQISN